MQPEHITMLPFLTKIMLVGSGGFAGAVLRYAIVGAAGMFFGERFFPAGTLAVNVLGCAAIGICAGLAEQWQFFTDEIRLLLFIGFTGSFTTFSTFGYETVVLMKNGKWSLGFINITAQLVIGLAVLWAAYRGVAMLQSS